MFSRRWLINYLLFTLIIIFTWIGTRYPVGQQQQEKRDRITSLRPQDIDSIKIETAEATIRLRKQGSRWLIDQPVKWYANNIAAERLASLATLEASSRLPRDQIELASLGLTIPRAVVSLNQQAIYFGDTNQIGNRRYLLVNDNVFLSDDIHFPFINQGLSALLDRRMLPASLALQSLQSSDFKLLKHQGSWVSDNPEHSATAIAALINNWQTLQAHRIKPYDQGLSPLQKVVAGTDNAENIDFFVLSIQPEIIIARPDLGQQYHFPEQQYYKLLSLNALDD